MSKTAVFTVRPNNNISATVFANSGANQIVTVSVDDKVAATYSGSGSPNKLLGSGVFNSGKGKITVTVATGTDPQNFSDLVSVLTEITAYSCFGYVASNDWAGSNGNDSIIIIDCSSDKTS
jgi:hypothetical protein